MAPAVVTSIQPAPWPPTSPRGCRWFFLAPPRAGGTHRLGGGALSWSGVTVGSAASCQTLDRLAVAVGVDLDEEQRQPLSMGARRTRECRAVRFQISSPAPRFLSE